VPLEKGRDQSKVLHGGAAGPASRRSRPKSFRIEIF
jgi:hypothetical protein